MKNNVSQIQNKCFGCYSCESSCPQKCIKMTESIEGFFYPFIDNEKCTNCGICMKKCPASKENIIENKQTAFAFKLNEQKDLIKSASGGACHMISQAILNDGGTVFGCAYDDNLHVKHIEVQNHDDLYRLQSSKYVQSNLQGIYQQIKLRLTENRKVLFIGTPCQVAGLHSFLGKDYSLLMTIDIICHGVPSPKLFEYYLKWKAEKLGGKITECNFRYKEKKGWGYYCKIANSKRIKYGYLPLDKYGNDFLKGKNFRECCYSCPFANMHRVSDITAGDFWGVERLRLGINHSLGISCVICNTTKGHEMMNKLVENATLKEVLLNDVVNGQQNLISPTKRPTERDTYYLNMDDRFFFYKKTPKNFLQRIKYHSPKALVSFVKRKLRR